MPVPDFIPAASLIDKAVEIRAVGGVYGGNQTPSEFLCLLLKLLQIQPEKEILLEYLQADEFKCVSTCPALKLNFSHSSRYLRALAAMYVRMTFHAVEVYEILEPLLKDFRKLRLRNMSQYMLISSDHSHPKIDLDGYFLTYIDEFVYQLLTEERVCDIVMPRIQKREILEETGELGPRKSRLLDAMEGEDEDRSVRAGSRSRSRSRGDSNRSSVGSRARSEDRSRSRSESRSLSRLRSGSPASAGSRYISKSPSRSRSGSRSPYRSRSRSISPDRMET